MEKADRGYWQYIRRSKNPEVPVVVLEESAAIWSVCSSPTSVWGLTVLTGNPVFDTNASILICLLLAVVSFILVRQNDEPADR
jgi:hypothetical protein